MDDVWKYLFSWIALGLTNLSNFYVDYASNLVIMATSIASFWLVIILIRLRSAELKSIQANKDKDK